MLASDREEESERASSHKTRLTTVVMEQKPARRGRVTAAVGGLSHES